ncbi:MAG: hypothetical protein ACYDH2_13435 [Anaerolineaceae bacterium]
MPLGPEWWPNFSGHVVLANRNSCSVWTVLYKKQPSLDILVNLCSIYGISLDEMVGLKDENNEGKINFDSLISDPVVKLLAEKFGVSAKALSAFIVAMKIDEG